MCPVGSCLPPSAERVQELKYSDFQWIIGHIHVVIWLVLFVFCFFDVQNINPVIFPGNGACPTTVGTEILVWPYEVR